MCNSKPCICNFPETLEGIKVLQLDTPNKNGRIYSTDTILHSLMELKSGVKFGMVGMPTSLSLNVDLEKVSHYTENLRIQDGWMICDIKPLDTPYGKILKQLYCSCIDAGFRPAGIGDIDQETGEVTKYILSGIHYVENPA